VKKPSHLPKHLLLLAVFWIVLSGTLESGIAQLAARVGLNMPILRDLPIVLACTAVSYLAMWCWARMVGYWQSGWWAYALYLEDEQRIVIGLFRLKYVAKEDRHIVTVAICYNTTMRMGRVDVNFQNPRGFWESNVVDFHGDRATIVYFFRRCERHGPVMYEQTDVPKKYLGVLLLNSRRDSSGELTDEYEGSAKFVHEAADHTGFVVCVRGTWKNQSEVEEALKKDLAAKLAHLVSPSTCGRIQGDDPGSAAEASRGAPPPSPPRQANKAEETSDSQER
jgi:hypothetical protein